MKGKGWVDAADVEVGDYVSQHSFALTVYCGLLKIVAWLRAKPDIQRVVVDEAALHEPECCKLH